MSAGRRLGFGASNNTRPATADRVSDCALLNNIRIRYVSFEFEYHSYGQRFEVAKLYDNG